MNSIQMTGKTVEDAIEIAIRELDADPNEVEIDVVSRGKSGVFGIGSEPAKVVVTRISQEVLTSEDVSDDSSLEDVSVSQGDVIEKGRETINKLIELMGIEVTSNLRRADNEDGGGPLFEIEGDDSGLLIGRRGETLRSLQFIIRMIARRHLDRPVDVYIDIQGYRDRRYKFVKNLAYRTAKKVIQLNEPIELDPMPPNERKIIHQSLSRDSRIVTESKGKGNTRYITIFPTR